MNESQRNLGASLAARLRNLAKQRGDDVQTVLTQFVLDRVLHRLAASPHGRDFVLKGAMLFTLWTSVPHRATRDIDLLGKGSPDLDRLTAVFRDVCFAKVEPDGVHLAADSVRAVRIKEDQLYHGVRVTLAATLGSARIGVQVDIGFGDAVEPGPLEVTLPSLLDLPATRILAYPREVVVAEKFQAMVSLGLWNSRMKDFFDLDVLAARFEFQGPMLANSIETTFVRRQTELPRAPPVALTAEYADATDKRAQWSAFVRRNRIAGAEFLGPVVERLRSFLWPVVLALHGERAMPGCWPPGGPWGAPP